MRLAWLLFSLCATVVPDVALAGSPEQRTRDAGIGLTVTGGVIALSGASLAVAGAASMGPCGDGQPDCNNGGAFMVVGGAGLAALSTPFLAVGIPLWVIGANRLEQASVGVVPTRDGARFVLAGTF